MRNINSFFNNILIIFCNFVKKKDIKRIISVIYYNLRHNINQSLKPTLFLLLMIIMFSFLYVHQSPAIWGTDSNLSSMQSLEGSEVDSRGVNLKRDSSVDRY